MKAAIALAGHSLRRSRVFVLGVALVLAGFQFLLTQVAGYLMRTQAFGMLEALVPEFARSLAGPSMLAFMSFSGVVSLGYFHPVVLASLLGLTIAIATEPAAEVESRFVDLTLARPIGRATLVTRTLMVLLVSGAIVLGMMTAATWTGLVCCTPSAASPPPARVIVSLAVNLALIAWCWAGIGLAMAAFVRRRATAAGVTGVAALAMYLLDYLGRVWDPARIVSALSPFHFFEPMSLISGAALGARDAATLLGIGLVGTIASYATFARRDL